MKTTPRSGIVQPRATQPATNGAKERAASHAEVVPSPAELRHRRRVGLITAGIVGLLILYGLTEPAVVISGWAELLRLLGA